jgi:hypothetical protein
MVPQDRLGHRIRQQGASGSRSAALQIKSWQEHGKAERERRRMPRLPVAELVVDRLER